MAVRSAVSSMATLWSEFRAQIRPRPDEAMLVRTDKTPPACSARTPAGIPIKTSGYALVGRTSFYLFFEEADPNGSVAFLVIDVRTGRTIIADVSADGIADPAQVHTITATPASLTIAFQRALNTQCSILASPQPCWRQITSTKDNHIPAEIARFAPPALACAHSYREAKTESDDPSIITYEAQVSWTSNGGRNAIRAAGPVGCRPTP